MRRVSFVSMMVLSASLGCSSSSGPPRPTTAGVGGGEEETGGVTGTGGGKATGGKGGSTGGASGSTGGAGGTGGGGSGGGGSGGSPGKDAGPDVGVAGDSGMSNPGGELEKFSFFVTSVRAMKRLSKNEMGFGGDLRYGMPTGLEGADKICTEIAESVMPGASAKGWRAFLSVVAGPDGMPVHASSRIGEGPWYDRKGRLVAMNKTDLLKTRPAGADMAIFNDLPNEDGIPNHTDGAPGCTGNACPDNHDTLTGTGTTGMLYRMDKQYTCNDWTSSERSGRPWCGHSWPRTGSGVNWMSALAEGGCAPGINLREQGGPNAPTVGAGGGYGGIYCFALKP